MQDPDASPMQQRDRQWASLMRAAQSGEAQAYTALLSQIAPYVRKLARRTFNNPADVEDAVQETLLTVHRVRHTYDPERAFTPWLAAIASRRIIDGLRRITRVARHESDDEIALETFSDPAANSQQEDVCSSRELEQWLQQLPPRQRTALMATKLQGLSLVEASAVSGQSVAALKVNVHRGLKALRALFRDTEP